MGGLGADEFFSQEGGFMVKMMFAANQSNRPPAAYQADGLPNLRFAPAYFLSILKRSMNSCYLILNLQIMESIIGHMIFLLQPPQNDSRCNVYLVRKRNDL